MTDAEKAKRRLADLRRRVEMVALTLTSMEERPDIEVNMLAAETVRMHLRMAVGQIEDYAKVLQRAIEPADAEQEARPPCEHADCCEARECRHPRNCLGALPYRRKPAAE